MTYRHPLYTDLQGDQYVEQEPVRNYYRIVDPKAGLKWSVRPSPLNRAIILDVVAVNSSRVAEAMIRMNQ